MKLTAILLDHHQLSRECLDEYETRTRSLCETLAKLRIETLLLTNNRYAWSPRTVEFPNELIDACRERVVRYALQQTRMTGPIIVLDPRYGIARTDLEEAIVCYGDRPSILLTAGKNGVINEALLIADATAYATDGEEALCYEDPYLLMLSEEKSFPLGWSRGQELAYTTERQLHFARIYPDRIGEALDADANSPDDLLRASRDNPERVACIGSIPSGERCLDVGCSDGAITIILGRSGKRIKGIDILPEAIEKAKARLAKEPTEIRKRVSFACVPAESFLMGETFDTIYLTEVLEHIPIDIDRQLLAKYASALAPGGNMVVSVPNRMAAERYVAERRTRWFFGGHVTHFTALSLKRLLTEYFSSVTFHTLPGDERPQDGVFLICDCKGRKR